MYIERNYGFWMTFNWSKKPFILGFIYATAISAASYFTDFYIALPWQPMSVIGNCRCFLLGLQEQQFIRQDLGGPENLVQHCQQQQVAWGSCLLAPPR